MINQLLAGPMMGSQIPQQQAPQQQIPQQIPQQQAGIPLGQRLSGLMGNPAMGAAMGLLGASYDQRINPYQSAMKGMYSAGEFGQRQRQQQLGQMQRSEVSKMAQAGLKTIDIDGDGNISPQERQRQSMLRLAVTTGDPKWVSEANKIEMKAGGFQGTSMEAQGLNAWLQQFPREQWPGIMQRLGGQRAAMPQTTNTPQGMFTRPGYDLDAATGQPQAAAPQPGSGMPAHMLPPKAMDEIKMLDRVKSSYASYRQKLQDIGPKLRPGLDKALLSSSNKDLMLEFKELVNLGVLNGPDVEIIEDVLTNPTSIYTNLLDATGQMTTADLLQVLDEVVGNKINKAGASVQSRYPGAPYEPLTFPESADPQTEIKPWEMDWSK